MNKDLSNFDVNELGKIEGKSLLVNVGVNSENVNAWLVSNAAHVNRLLLKNGALLIRGIAIKGSKKLSRVLTEIFSEDLLEYDYGSTPRTKKRGQIYTSTEYHPSETIPLHNEQAYTNRWPMNIGFYCVKPAESGGATPIADSREVYASIASEIREEFEYRKLLYVRNYGIIDLPWTNVFRTHDRQQVEQYCYNNDIEFEWLGDNNLRTRQLCNAVSIHPITQEKFWFNQAHLYHISSLSLADRESLQSVYKKEDLPRNVYYGDGEDIKFETLEHIRKAFLENMIVFQWQENDLLLLDNMLYSHGRQPYVGERSVLVGMAKAMEVKVSL